MTTSPSEPRARGSSLHALASVAQLADDMESVVSRLVEQARREHRSWADIGAALGITRQAAHARYGHSVPGEQLMLSGAEEVDPDAEAP